MNTPKQVNRRQTLTDKLWSLCCIAIVVASCWLLCSLTIGGAV